jgi:hypothetical protein
MANKLIRSCNNNVVLPVVILFFSVWLFLKDDLFIDLKRIIKVMKNKNIAVNKMVIAKTLLIEHEDTIVPNIREKSPDVISILQKDNIPTITIIRDISINSCR